MADSVTHSAVKSAARSARRGAADMSIATSLPRSGRSTDLRDISRRTLGRQADLARQSAGEKVFSQVPSPCLLASE
ncbi:hypothetical protein GCM10012285_07380 [Streptomyces kronopolitis]|uniref:FXSXX-COOH protein n=1 Tax=Streptomyces kronopolitis TaxID=1612435 RepID=A0ABQ2J0W8_9ACTN|nr:hypothetical protein GCM10012285_07380 [Streptomyces kronopolitis]